MDRESIPLSCMRQENEVPMYKPSLCEVALYNVITYNVPMNNSTRKKSKDNKFIALKKKLTRPSDSTLFFLQMFARTYNTNPASAM